MEPVSLTTNDLCHHVVTFGMDIWRPVDLPNEQTRMNMFFEEAKQQRGNLFDQLIISSTEFRISKKFRKRDDLERPSYQFDTFALTDRGPVFIFPLMLPPPIGDTNLEESYLDDFNHLRGLFFDAIPQRAVMRVGLVRDLVFSTGSNKREGLLTGQTSFAKAALVGGSSIHKYRNEKCNHNILVEPVTFTRTTRLGVGATVNEPTGYGVHVRLDVNNAEVRQPLQETDIRGVLERATSLWPNELLEYLEVLFEGRRS